MKKCYLTLIFILSLSAQLFAQERYLCGTVNPSPQEQASANALNMAVLQAKQKAQLLKSKLKTPTTLATPVNGVYTVPVVVHIVHTGQSLGAVGNPTDSQVASFINLLNQGFSNTFNVGKGLNSVDTKIQFTLAKRGQNCDNTTGIFRYDLSGNVAYANNGVGKNGGIERADLLNLTGNFDNLSYYNLYIINKIDGTDMGFIGSATLDNMIILAKVVPTGQTIIHEMGHSFGLKHVFEGSSGSTCPINTDCNVNGDGICDTEPALQDVCNPTTNNPCTQLPWTGTQFNHMGYYCGMDRFTPQQVSLMQNVLQTTHASYKTSVAGLPLVPNSTPVSMLTPGADASQLGNILNYGPVFVGFNDLSINSNDRASETPDKKHYIDHSCTQTTSLVAGATYPLTVITGGNPHIVKVFIDYNNDGVIADNTTEMVMSTSGSSSGLQTFTVNVTIPSTGVALNTPLRMRVIADRQDGTPVTATSVIKRGQIEDYTLFVSGTLPVSLKEASAYINGNTLFVNWNTASENNVDRFEIQLSDDGQTFKTVGKLNSKATDGNSSVALSYDYSCNLSQTGTLFISLFSLAGVLLISIRHRKRYLIVSCIAGMMIIAGSCRKSVMPEETAKGDKYVRLVQVDKDGKSYTLFTTMAKKQ